MFFLFFLCFPYFLLIFSNSSPMFFRFVWHPKPQIEKRHMVVGQNLLGWCGSHCCQDFAIREGILWLQHLLLSGQTSQICA